MEDQRLLARLGAPLATLALLASASACVSHEVVDPTPLDIVLAELPKEPPAYRIQPGDQLEVRFFQVPEQNALLPVRPDGYISLPLATEVRAASRTPEEVRLELQERYSKELRDPQIAVIVQTFSSYRIHVGGHVAQPGLYDLSGGRAVLQVIFEAGGFLDSASLEDVLVMRRTGDESFIVIPLDLEAALSGEDTRQNMMLQPFDLVYVPPSPIANVNRWVDLYLRKNIPFSLSVGWRYDF